MLTSPKVLVFGLVLALVPACTPDRHEVPDATDEEGDAAGGDGGDGDIPAPSCSGSAPYLHLGNAQTLDPIIENPDRCLVYGLDSSQDALYIVDTANDQVTGPIALGSHAVDMALSADRQFLYVALVNDFSTIARLDAATGTFVDDAATSVPPFRIARGSGTRVYYVEEELYAAVHEVDFGNFGADTTVTATEFHEPDLDASADGETLYLGEANQAGSRLFRFDAGEPSLPELGHFRFDGGFTLPSPERKIFLAEAADRVFFADRSFESQDLARMRGWLGAQVVAATQDGKIVATAESLFDGETFIRFANRPHPETGALFSADGFWLYEFDATSSLLYRTKVSALVGLYPLGETVVPAGSLSQHDFYQLLVDPVRPLIYALDPQQNQVVVIDRNTRLARHAEIIGSSPTDMALGADGDELVLATFGATELAVLDLTRGDKQLKDVINVPGNPFRIAISSGGIIAYAEQDQLTDVTLVDRVTGEVLVTETDAIFQPDLEFDPTGQYLYTGESSGPEAHLERFDISDHQFISAGVSAGTYSFPSRRVVYQGGKVYFAGHRFDATSLADEGSYGEDILLVTPDGKFAVSRRHIFDAATFAERDGLPVDSGVIAVDPTSTVLYQFDNETGALFERELPTD